MPGGRFPKRPLDPERWKRGAGGGTRKSPAAETAWEDQAGWYDQRQGERGDDLHRDVVLPAVLRRLDARAGQAVLDLACGQGLLGRILAPTGVACVGLDASPSMIEAACERAGDAEEYLVADVRNLDSALPDRTFDHAAAVLALQDLEPLAPVFEGAAAKVVPGGRLVIVITHPCFRAPKLHRWGWDEERGVQYRRLDGYLSKREVPIRTHPGHAADTASTTSFHRPLAAYLETLGAAGWGVVGAEELCSPRRGSEGRKSAAEDRAMEEFPVFLLLVATRLGDGG